MMEDIELKKHPETGVLVPEEWKPIEGYDGWYEVSNYGRVRSWHKWGRGKGRSDKPRLLSISKKSDGYLKTSLNDRNSNRHTYVIHRLVAESFVPNLEEKLEINHKDGIKTNNFYLNLEWCTRKENINHAIESGLINIRGEKCGKAKLSKEDVLEIKDLYDTGDYYQREIGEMYGIDPTQVSRIISGKRWGHIS